MILWSINGDFPNGPPSLSVYWMDLGFMTISQIEDHKNIIWNEHLYEFYVVYGDYYM